MDLWVFHFQYRHMRLHMLIAVFVASCLLIGIADAAEPPKISLIEGEAWIRTSETKEEKTAITREFVPRTDQQVQTAPSGKIEFRYPDSCVVRLGPSSALRIGAQEGDAPRAFVLTGNAWINASAFNRQAPIRFATATCLIEINSNSVCRIIIHPDQAVEIKVYQGILKVVALSKLEGNSTGTEPSGPTPAEKPKQRKNEKWENEMAPFTKMIVWPDGNATKPFRFAEKGDRTEWVLWNQARDSSQRP